MPEMSPEAKASVFQHVKSNWLDKRPCPVCETTQWVYPDTLVELREFAYGSIGQEMVPVVVVTCQRCGYMLLFNAIHVQAVKLPGRADRILDEHSKNITDNPKGQQKT